MDVIETLPMVPLRDVVVFPHMMMPFVIGRPSSIKALEYALQFGRGIDEAVADRFVSMYVNDLTQDYGDEGRTAVAELLRRGEAIGALPPVTVDWIE